MFFSQPLNSGKTKVSWKSTLASCFKTCLANHGSGSIFRPKEQKLIDLNKIILTEDQFCIIFLFKVPLQFTNAVRKISYRCFIFRIKYKVQIFHKRNIYQLPRPQVYSWPCQASTKKVYWCVLLTTGLHAKRRIMIFYK